MIYVNSVSVSPASLTLRLNHWYYNLRASVLPVNATCTSVEWSSSDPLIVSVNRTNGYIFSNSIGTAYITATALDGSGKSATCQVRVIPNTRIQVTPSTLTLYAGETYVLEKTLTGNKNAEISWTSSDESVVTVNHSSGFVRALKAGTATVTVHALDETHEFDTCEITVLPVIPVTRVTVNKSTLRLRVGESGMLSASVTPSNATNPKITWSSGSISIAKVNSVGLVTAVAPGDCYIYARSSDGSGKYGYCHVYVPEPTAIQVTPTELTVYEGATQMLTATVTPAEAAEYGVSWTSMNPAVAQVNHATGLLTAVSAGTARIRAETLDGSNLYAECVVTVLSPIPVQSVTIAPAQLTLRIDETADLSATVLPANATNKELLWHSDNEDVVTVGDMSGTVYAYAAGTAHIYATAQDGSNVYGVCTVTVPVPTTVTVAPSELTLYAGESQLLTAAIAPAEAADAGISWTSLNPDIAQINHASGMLTAVSAGTVSIRALALDGSCAAGYCTVTVLPFIPVSSVTVTPATLTLAGGESADLSALVLPANATNSAVRWTSDNNNVLVSNGHVHNFWHTDTCTVTIRATAVDGSNKYGSCVVTALGRRQLHITPDELTLHVGESYCLSMSATPEGVTIPDVSWESSDKSIVNVNHASGMITAESVGTATIQVTATDGSEDQAFCTVTVLPYVPVESVTVTPTLIALGQKQTYTLTATVLPENATNKNLIWRTTDANVVGVDESGNLIGKGSGLTTVTATPYDAGARTGSCWVVVSPNEENLVTSIEVIPERLTLHIGDSYLLEAIVTPENATKDTPYWGSSAENVALVNKETGMVFAVGAGTATIYADAKDFGNVSDYCTVTVLPNVSVESVTMAENAINLSVGDTCTPETVVQPADATIKALYWASDNEAVAAVNPATGTITAKAAGTANITATSRDGSKERAVCTVIVA